MPRILGYIASGRTGQSVQEQRELLIAAGASQTFQEKTSELKRERPQLAKLLAAVNQGDTIVIGGLDTFVRSTKHLLELLEKLSTAGVSLKVLDNSLDTSKLDGETLRTLLGAIGEFERQVVRERQAEGIARAKREGRYKGRKPTAMAKADEVLALNAQGLTRQKIADDLGIGVASVYRILKNNTTPKKIRKKTQKKPVEKPKKVARKPTREPDTEQLSFF